MGIFGEDNKQEEFAKEETYKITKDQLLLKLGFDKEKVGKVCYDNEKNILTVEVK